MSSDMLGSAFDFLESNGLMAEMLVSVAIFTAGLPRRSSFAWRVTGAIMGLLVVSVTWSSLTEASFWTDVAKFLVLLGLFGAVIAACWRLAPRQVVLYLVMAAVLQHFAFRGAELASSLAVHIYGWTVPVESVAYALALVPFYVVGWAAFVRRLKNRPTEGVQGGAVLMLLIGMLLFVNVFTNAFDAINPASARGVARLYSLFDLVTCVFVLALTVEMVRRESAEHDSEITRHLLRQQKTQLESSKETIELVNVKAHDLKAQIELLNGRIPREELDELSGLVGTYDSTTHTGNGALDVLLAAKSLRCENLGIRFDRVIDGASLAFVGPADVYSLFGNAIDNAMEAVACIAEPEQRYLSLHVRRKMGMVAIHMENPYVGPLRFEGALPGTTKEDRRLHGFGMRSMQIIVEKYEGHLAVSADQGVFWLTALLPAPDATGHRVDESGTV